MSDPSDAYSVGQGTWSNITALTAGSSRSVTVNYTGQYQIVGYAGATDGMWVSSNYGSNWVKKLSGFSQWLGGAISSNGQYQAISAQGAFYRSADYGTTWSSNVVGLPAGPNVLFNSMSLDGSWQFTAANNSVWISSNYGVNWVQNSAMAAKGWTGIANSSNGQYVVVSAGNDDSGIWISSDYGSNFSVKLTGSRYQYTAMSGSGQYLLAISFQASGYFLSSNYGSNWAYTSYGSPIFKDSWVSLSGKCMIVAARGAGTIRIRVSTDFGVSWSNTSSIQSDWNAVDASEDGKYILAGNDAASNTIYQSISPIKILPPNAPTSVQVSGTNLIWTAPTQPVDLYRIFSFSNSTYTLTASTTTSSIALTSLPPNTSLPYAVTASNLAGVSAYSALSATVNNPPRAPTSVIGDGTNLSWTTPVGGADFYKVYINNISSYVYYVSTVSTAVAYSNLFVGSNIRYNITANGNISGESAYSASSPAITVSFESLPDNSVDGATYVDALLGLGTSSSNLTAQLQGNTDKFVTPIIEAGVVDIREVVNSNLVAPGFTVSSFASSATTFLAISTSQTVTVPVENLPSSNAIFYIPATQGDSFSLSIQGKPYSFVNSGISSFTVDGRSYTLGDVFQMGGKLFQYAAVGSLVLLGQGFQQAPSTPVINIRPECSNQTIYYSWVTEGISTLSLVLEGYSTFTLPYSAKSYTASGLTNGTKYSAYITNNDGNSSSEPSYFRTVEPGNKPSIVQNVTGLINPFTSSISLNWTHPASNGGATIGWYVFEDTVSTLKYNTYGTDTSITLPFVGYSTFNVYAVNDPGYSPASNVSLPVNIIL